ncbi:hypothetical protein JTB14_032151 [Gonioctena quinquepunctata]|nr:hypothetical protein JTB14_032151 [Gonioctena quinquepunctata]
MKLKKNSSDDFVAYASQVNKSCEDFKIRQITPDQFKCLIFVCGLQSSEDADVRTKLLSRIDGKEAETMNVQDLTTQCQRILNLKKDTSMVQGSSQEQFHVFTDVCLLLKLIIMNERKPEICRLCLKAVSENFTFLNGTKNDMIQIILPQIDLNLFNDNIICIDCDNFLSEAFSFKTSCLEIEDTIHNYTNEGTIQVNLEKILGLEENEEDCEKSGILKICRTCLEMVDCESYEWIIGNEQCFLTQMLKKCLPEMDIGLTKVPVLCNVCKESIKVFYDFLAQCMDNEEKIMDYIKSNPPENFNLFEFHNFMFCKKDPKLEINFTEPMLRTEIDLPMHKEEVMDLEENALNTSKRDEENKNSRDQVHDNFRNGTDEINVESRPNNEKEVNEDTHPDKSDLNEDQSNEAYSDTNDDVDDPNNGIYSDFSDGHDNEDITNDLVDGNATNSTENSKNVPNSVLPNASCENPKEITSQNYPNIAPELSNEEPASNNKNDDVMLITEDTEIDILSSDEEQTPNKIRKTVALTQMSNIVIKKEKNISDDEGKNETTSRKRKYNTRSRNRYKVRLVVSDDEDDVTNDPDFQIQPGDRVNQFDSDSEEELTDDRSFRTVIHNTNNSRRSHSKGSNTGSANKKMSGTPFPENYQVPRLPPGIVLPGAGAMNNWIQYQTFVTPEGQQFVGLQTIVPVAPANEMYPNPHLASISGHLNNVQSNVQNIGYPPVYQQLGPNGNLVPVPQAPPTRSIQSHNAAAILPSEVPHIANPSATISNNNSPSRPTIAIEELLSPESESLSSKKAEAVSSLNPPVTPLSRLKEFISSRTTPPTSSSKKTEGVSRKRKNDGLSSRAKRLMMLKSLLRNESPNTTSEAPQNTADSAKRLRKNPLSFANNLEKTESSFVEVCELDVSNDSTSRGPTEALLLACTFCGFKARDVTFLVKHVDMCRQRSANSKQNDSQTPNKLPNQPQLKNTTPGELLPNKPTPEEPSPKQSKLKKTTQNPPQKATLPENSQAQTINVPALFWCKFCGFSDACRNIYNMHTLVCTKTKMSMQQGKCKQVLRLVGNTQQLFNLGQKEKAKLMQCQDTIVIDDEPDSGTESSNTENLSQKKTVSQGDQLPASQTPSVQGEQTDGVVKENTQTSGPESSELVQTTNEMLHSGATMGMNDHIPGAESSTKDQPSVPNDQTGQTDGISESRTDEQTSEPKSAENKIFMMLLKNIVERICRKKPPQDQILQYKVSIVTDSRYLKSGISKSKAVESSVAKTCPSTEENTIAGNQSPSVGIAQSPDVVLDKAFTDSQISLHEHLQKQVEYYKTLINTEQEHLDETHEHPSESDGPICQKEHSIEPMLQDNESAATKVPICETTNESLTQITDQHSQLEDNANQILIATQESRDECPASESSPVDKTTKEILQNTGQKESLIETLPPDTVLHENSVCGDDKISHVLGDQQTDPIGDDRMSDVPQLKEQSTSNDLQKEPLRDDKISDMTELEEQTTSNDQQMETIGDDNISDLGEQPTSENQASNPKGDDKTSDVSELEKQPTSKEKQGDPTGYDEISNVSILEDLQSEPMDNSEISDVVGVGEQSTSKGQQGDHKISDGEVEDLITKDPQSEHMVDDKGLEENPTLRDLHSEILESTAQSRLLDELDSETESTDNQFPADEEILDSEASAEQSDLTPQFCKPVAPGDEPIPTEGSVDTGFQDFSGENSSVSTTEDKQLPSNFVAVDHMLNPLPPIDETKEDSESTTIDHDSEPAPSVNHSEPMEVSDSHVPEDESPMHINENSSVSAEEGQLLNVVPPSSENTAASEQISPACDKSEDPASSSTTPWILISDEPTAPIAPSEASVHQFVIPKDLAIFKCDICSFNTRNHFGMESHVLTHFAQYRLSRRSRIPFIYQDCARYLEERRKHVNNIRERIRTGQQHEAWEKLRNLLPRDSNVQLTQARIIKGAIDYINRLDEQLKSDEPM